MINLYQSSYEWVQGIYHYDTSNPWPHIVISCLTHWWELLWLRVIEYLLNEYTICPKLTLWSITFMISNIKAYEHFLQTNDMAWSRYIDENMNRCATSETICYWSSSEAKRLREIVPFLEIADYHIDIHSTSQSAKSMAIYTSRSMWLYQHIINADEHYQDLILYQKGSPLIDICETHWWYGLWLETGREWDSKAYHNGVENVLSVLHHLWMIDSVDMRPEPKSNTVYCIIGSIMVSDAKTFIPTKHYQHNEYIISWTIIAHQDWKPITINTDCMIVMPSKQIIWWEEYCFLAAGKW